MRTDGTKVLTDNLRINQSLRPRLFGIAYRMFGSFADATTSTSDGGGKVPAARNTLVGTERIGRLLLALERKGKGIVRHTVEWINGEPAIVSHANGTILATTSIATDGDRLIAFYRVLNRRC